MSDPTGYELRSRPELIEEARRAGVERPERMTRAELRDEILRLTRPASEQAEVRGLFGVARSMLASVVESGLNLPDAARLIRGSDTLGSTVRDRTPVATVTLAEIYAAQGHRKRALRMLEEVLAQEPDHEVALRLRRELSEGEQGAASVALADPREAPGYVETTGIEVKTGQPPEAAPASVPSREAPSSEAPSSEAPSSEAPSSEAPSSEAPSVEASSAPAQPIVAPASPDGPAVLLQRGATLALYWELSRGDLEAAGFEAMESTPALRVVAFVPRRGAPAQEERTYPIEVVEGRGVLRLDDWAETDQVRAAVGVLLEGAFVPLAVAKRLEEVRARSPELASRAESALGVPG